MIRLADISHYSNIPRPTLDDMSPQEAMFHQMNISRHGVDESRVVDIPRHGDMNRAVNMSNSVIY